MSHVCVLKCHPHLFKVSTHGYSQNQILVWKYPSLTQVAKLTGHSYRVLYLVSEIIRVFSRFTETAFLFEMNLEAVIRAWSYNLLADWDFPKLQINNVLYFSTSVRLHDWIVWISGHLCDKNKLYIYPGLSLRAGGQGFPSPTIWMWSPAIFIGKQKKNRTKRNP